MILTHQQKQAEYLRRLNSIGLPCPNCGTLFPMTGNEFGNPTYTREGVTIYSPMARCPECSIVFTQALGLHGQLWWSAVREIERIPEGI